FYYLFYYLLDPSLYPNVAKYCICHLPPTAPRSILCPNRSPKLGKEFSRTVLLRICFVGEV
ncbi:hypothetical protein, partial [Adhaeribacter rhizoryzae]|uniref:hypothetical protein n=1 Tax=Adhaeribacter rhizoryzae TaxID=2607907 RepID=UPI001CC1F0C0